MGFLFIQNTMRQQGEWECELSKMDGFGFQWIRNRVCVCVRGAKRCYLCFIFYAMDNYFEIQSTDVWFHSDLIDADARQWNIWAANERDTQSWIAIIAMLADNYFRNIFIFKSYFFIIRLIKTSRFHLIENEFKYFIS